MNKELIIEIPYGGLGDHLFHSHLPRIAKETGVFDKVYISSFSLFRHVDNKKLIWDLNPFVDGFSDRHGKKVDIASLVKVVNDNSKNNLLDEIMLAYGLDNGKRWNEPEVYYRPKVVQEFDVAIYDPNYLSWVGLIDKFDAMRFFKKEGIVFDKIMKIRTDKALFIPTDDTSFIDTVTLFDFCDLIHSAKKLYCLTSGTATLAAALNKPASVFYGKGQPAGFRHSKKHHYIEIKKSIIKQIKTDLSVFKSRMFGGKSKS